jgi:hypothetical protein
MVKCYGPGIVTVDGLVRHPRVSLVLLVLGFQGSGALPDSPRSPVKTLPAVADTIRCPGVILSAMTGGLGAGGDPVPDVVAIVESSNCAVHDVRKEAFDSVPN